MRLLPLICLTSIAKSQELFRAATSIRCSTGCINIEKVWCPDYDFAAGGCFNVDDDLELKVNAFRRGNYKFCSNHYQSFKGNSKFFSCPLQ